MFAINSLSIFETFLRNIEKNSILAMLYLAGASKPYVESFNFSGPADDWTGPIRHINGSCDNPIFGIDSSGIDDKSDAFIFTKASRRAEAEALRIGEYERKMERPPFDGAVVYGHSLSPADYNYFFPLFDDLRLYDPSSSGKIVFAFSAFSDGGRGKRAEEFSRSVASIIYDYDRYRTRGESAQLRLFESLQVEKKIAVIEI
jgi:hypothetical protein